MKNRDKLLKDLKKIMPGYKWTVHRALSDSNIEATGVQSSGFNRLSTLNVIRSQSESGAVFYTVRSSGFGKRSPWLATKTGYTLAQALRNLQGFYEREASNYFSHAGALKVGRINKED